MDNQQAYNLWAFQYDTNINKTRDLEAIALRSELNKIPFSDVLEIGCGTGKNGEWLVTKAQKILAVDFSEEMLNKAKEKIQSDRIRFKHADITLPWAFTTETYDLAVFSLVLEHIENLDFIFSELAGRIKPGGFVYIGELHPFKQYTGSLARFDLEHERVELKCFVHHVSEFVNTAAAHGFSVYRLNEWFDEEGEKGAPRILTMIFVRM